MGDLKIGVVEARRAGTDDIVNLGKSGGGE